MRNEPLNNADGVSDTAQEEKVEKRAPEGITTRSPIHNFVRGALSGAGLNSVNTYMDNIKKEREDQEDYDKQQAIDAQKQRDNEANQTGEDGE